MQLVPVPAFSDNYIWLLHNGQDALVVDPGDPAPVLATLAALGLSLRHVWVTHHHADHTGGVAALQAACNAQVHAPRHECPNLQAHRVSEGDTLSALGLSWRVMDVPGHTAGHVAYFAERVPLHPAPAPVLFCGDTLFSAGCGRLFEGTAAQLQRSLHRLALCPPDTQVCCAHEYTLGNLAFAKTVEPDNREVDTWTVECQRLRAQGLPTLPSTVGRERAINPFLRTDRPSIRRAALAHAALKGPRAPQAPGNDPDLQTFATLRAWKNQF
jgi:hydroxyacylglutathione hydrolase